MKRLLAALFILLALAGANAYTRSLLRTTGDRLLAEVERVEQLAAAADEAAGLEAACTDLQALWLQTEKTWSHFLNRDRLETVTIEVARLPLLARCGELGDTAAGLRQIHLLVEKMLAFESPEISDFF